MRYSKTVVASEAKARERERELWSFHVRRPWRLKTCEECGDAIVREDMWMVRLRTHGDLVYWTNCWLCMECAPTMQDAVKLVDKHMKAHKYGSPRYACF